MRQTWRWFGPDDTVSLPDIRQAGAEGIVTALYHIRPGEVWPRDQIRARREEIEAAGLTWDVVESLPVSEAIRNGSADAEAHFSNWATSLEHLAAEGWQIEEHDRDHECPGGPAREGLPGHPFVRSASTASARASADSW